MVVVQSLQPVVVSSSQRMFLLLLFFFFFVFLPLFDSLNFIIIDVPRPLSNFLWIIIFKSLMRNAYTEPVCLERLRASDPYFQFCKYRHASKLLFFIYTCICYCYFCRILTENVYRTLNMCNWISVLFYISFKVIADIYKKNLIFLSAKTCCICCCILQMFAHWT